MAQLVKGVDNHSVSLCQSTVLMIVTLNNGNCMIVHFQKIIPISALRIESSSERVHLSFPYFITTTSDVFALNFLIFRGLNA